MPTKKQEAEQPAAPQDGAQPAPQVPTPREGTPGVYAKLYHAQQVVEGVTRSGHNDHFDYRFVEEHAVLEVARQALRKAGLVFTYSVAGLRERTVKTRQGREELMTDLRLRFALVDPEDGTRLEWDYYGRGQDNMDKGVNKALVAGVKYGLLKLLMIPTGDDAEDASNDARTGGGNERARAPRGGFKCPECGSPMYDNRDDPSSSRQGGTRPAFKCKRDAKHVIWGRHPDEPRDDAQDGPQEAPGAQGGPAPAPTPPAQPQAQQAAPAPAQAPGPWDARRDELQKMTKGQLLTVWNELLIKDGFGLRSVLVLAYALADPGVHDEPARWTKDHYVRAIVAAEQRGGARRLLEGSMLHLANKAPATEGTSTALQKLLDDVEDRVDQADREWYHDALHCGAEPVAKVALDMLASLFPVEAKFLAESGTAALAKGGAAGKKPDDDLPF